MNQRRENTMLSRVADTLYWMSRYLERAVQTARLLDVDFQLRLDQMPDAGAGRWLQLLEASQAPPPDDGKIDATTLSHILTLDKANPSSVISCISKARENQAFAEGLINDSRSGRQWGLIVRFYSAVHYVEAYLSSLNCGTSSHEARRRAIKARPELAAIADHFQDQRRLTLPVRLC